MLRRTNVACIIVVMAVSVATGTMLGTAHAQKAAVPKVVDKLALGEAEVRQLLLLMDTDKNGPPSRSISCAPMAIKASDWVGRSKETTSGRARTPCVSMRGSDRIKRGR
jgi:hypothetical protein